MKKQFLWAALTAVTFFGSSCNNDDPNQEKQEGNEVTFVIGGIGSRTATDANYATSFETGDKVGITSSGLQSDADNTEFTVAINEQVVSLTSTTTYKFKSDETEATFNAYYPYTSENYSEGTITHTIEADQITEDNFNAQDFMVATTKGNSKSESVALNFSHQMALVEVNLSGDGLTDASNVTMNISKNEISYNFNGTDNNLTVSGTTGQVKMYDATTQDAADKKFWAIIPPQTLTGDGFTPLFTMTVGDKDYAYYPADDITLSSNQIYKITLAIEEEGGNLAVFNKTSVQIVSWSTPVTSTEGSITNRLKFKATMPTTIATTTSGRNDFNKNNEEKPDTWLSHTLSTAEFDSNESAIKIGNTTQNTGWYNNTLYYYGGSSRTMKDGNNYKISFKVKTDLSESNKLDVLVSGLKTVAVDNQNKNIMYLIETGVTRKSITNISTSEYMNIELTINPEKYSNDTKSNSTTEASNKGDAYENDIVLYFAPQTTGNYWIKDVTVEEVAN